jgi:enoyl-CoA hydratase/carnithine racemase
MNGNQGSPIEVFSARDIAEAYLVRGMLQEDGIDAMVVGESLGGIAGEVPPLQATPRIWVRPIDADRARQLIEQFERQSAARSATTSNPPGSEGVSAQAELFCYHCGETVDYGQTSCPACGKSLERDPDEASDGSSRGDSQEAGPSSVLLDVIDGIAVLTLNNPDKRNPLSFAVLSELQSHLQSIASDRAIRAVIIRAAGPAFSAGHDLRELVNATKQQHRSLFNLCSQVMESIRNLPKPVIAEVQGVATAAGCQLAATCDLVVAAENATFATPGVKIGLFCSTPAVAVSRVVPLKKAMEMLLTGEPISAREAERVGLVNRVVSTNQLHDEAMKLARQVIASSSDTLGLGKRTFYEQLQLDRPAAYELTSRVMVENAQLPDAQEGMRAFLEKRLPEWKE